MSQIGKSLLRGAVEALAYARGQAKGARSHKVKIPTHVNVRTIRVKLRTTLFKPTRISH